MNRDALHLSPADAAILRRLVGSGTVVFGGLAWRFHPDDFRMASRYGVPEGSSLVDWPIGYEDLAPWYDKAEHEIGVAGKTGHRHEGPRLRDYPMPPFPRRGAARMVAAGADRLGISCFHPPLLINSVPRDGRGVCIECGSCVGFPCPTDAKNGTHNTAIPRALATDRCDLLTIATGTNIERDDTGRVVGVRYQQGMTISSSATLRCTRPMAGSIRC